MSLTPLARRALLLVGAAALLSPLVPSARAQTAGLAPPDSLSAPEEQTVAAPDSTAPPAIPADSLALSEAPEAPPAPTLHAFGDGLRVTLAPGWDGPASVRASPAGAVYGFQNEAPGHPLQGVAVRVERVDGLNALLRERWSRGLTASGYAGLGPVGPAAAPMPGFGVEVADAVRGGATVFAIRGASSWAVQVTAPLAVWRARRADVLAVLAGVALP